MGRRDIPPNTGRVALSASIFRSRSLWLLVFVLALPNLPLLLLSDEVRVTGAGCEAMEVLGEKNVDSTVQAPRRNRTAMRW
jgi:hypothetical protein